MSDVGWEYLIYEHPSRGRQVGRREALRYIESHGLVEVLNRPEGQVYDTPGRAFLAEFRGYFSDRDDEERRAAREERRQSAIRRAERILHKQ